MARSPGPARGAASAHGSAHGAARAPRGRIGLALAGGGPLGAIYEIGAINALAEALPGLDFTRLHSYVGVSAGGFIAAALVNGIGPAQLVRSFILNEGEPHDVFDPATMLRPAWAEFAQRLGRLPQLSAQAGWKMLRGRTLLSSLEPFGQAMPAGLLDSETMQRHLERIFSAPGRHNDFRRLPRQLVLVATDLDSGEAAPFGLPGFDHVPISRAVQASAALPGLFPPVEIDGHCYVDGALKKTLHASVLLEQGLDLLICLNPLVPFDTADAPPGSPPTRREHLPRIAEGGLPVVLSQTFRSLIHSRLELGMRRYEHSHPDTDIVLFEPDHHDAQMFLANTFSYSQRRRLAEHAYQRTRATLRDRRAELAPQLARHGLALDEAVLADPHRVLVDNGATRLERSGLALKRLDAVLAELEERLAVPRAPATQRA